MSDWVYSGVFRDVYGEFMIQVNEEYLSYRGEETQYLHTHIHTSPYKNLGFGLQALKMKNLPDT